MTTAPVDALQTAQAKPRARAGTMLPPVLALLFGLFLLYGTGFAQPELLHNAAHDSRHSFAFPCH